MLAHYTVRSDPVYVAKTRGEVVAVVNVARCDIFPYTTVGPFDKPMYW